MCGRYTFQHAEALRQLIESLTGESYPQYIARYNVAPPPHHALGPGTGQ